MLLVNPIIIGYFFYLGSGSELFQNNLAYFILALGQISGLLAVYLVLLQFVMIGRVSWVESVFGLDKLARIHKWSGYSLAFFLTLHPLFITIAYAAISGKTLIGQELDFIFNYDDILKAMLALLILIAVIFLSITIVRKKFKYETWYFVHLSVYLAVILAFSHQLELGHDFGNINFVIYWYFLYFFALGNFIFFRFGRPLYFFYRHQFKISQVVRENKEVVSIYIAGRNLNRFKIKAGQFIIVRILTKDLWWQAHPFSLSKLPSSSHLRITVKAKGDYTAKLQSLQAGSYVLIDGPNGTFTRLKNQPRKVLLIAGGIGITPIRALFEEFANNKYDINFIYAAQHETDLVFRSEIDLIGSQFGSRITYVLSRDQSWDGERGYLDDEKLMRLVPDIKERETYLCGPASMMKKMRITLHQMGVRKPIRYEKFSL